MHIYYVILVTALRAIRRNIMRSALTCLGIIIAVAAVIAMVEIGNGSSSAIQKTISSMGANMLMVFPGAASSAGISFGAGTGVSLTPDDAAAIQRECTAVRAVAPVVRARGQIVYGDKNWVPQNIQGTTPDFLVLRDWTTMAEGIPFSDTDVRNANKVCIIGQTIKRQFFPNESALGQEIRLQNVGLKVIGVLSSKGANMMGQDQDDIVVIPWTTVKYRINGNGGTSGSSGGGGSTVSSGSTPISQQVYPSSSTSIYPSLSSIEAQDNPRMTKFANIDQILAGAATVKDIPLAIDQITAVLHDRHHIGAGETDDFTIRNMTEMTDTLTSASKMMTQLLLVVAAISLVVGGVGIMNIMMVSVTERTREIGLRMAVGARGRDILKQFLIEAVVLCLIGGLIGLLCGRISSIVVTALMHWPTKASYGAAIAALGVSAIVGIVFGFYPAWKASRLDPIEALRYE
ncbi:MAG TPA: ABC transporter permease [Opitutales bacterium]|nr:ABC transporter permease [Opitutales bacterium]